MKTKYSWGILSFCLLLIISVGLVGCGMAQRKPFSTRMPAPTTPAPTETTPRTTPAPATPSTPSAPASPMPTGTKEVTNLQNKLAQEAEKVPGVNKAWVVLSGKTALVGAELERDVPRGGQGDAAGVKNEIMMRLRKADNRLTGVAVATDAGTVNQVRKVAEGMRANKPASTFSQDVDDLVRKLAPGMR